LYDEAFPTGGKIFAIMLKGLRRFGSKNRKFGGFFPGKGVPKTIFGLWWHDNRSRRKTS
jgi:hypothetical protein